MQDDSVELSDEETKRYVTPYAFHVASHLLGKPLASPSRRLLAITIDMICIALLTLLDVLFLMALMSALAMSAGLKAWRKPPQRSSAAVWLMLSAVLALAVVIGLKFDGDAGGSERPINDVSVVDVDRQEASTSVPAADATPSLIQWVKAAITDLGLSFGWAVLYFTVLTAWMDGQTFAKKLLGVKVIRIDGKPLGLWDSFGRYGGYGAGLATGLLGFLQIYWDPNRQAIQDKISETVVINLRKPSIIAEKVEL